MSLFPDDPPPRSSSGASRSSGWVHAHCDGGSRGNPGPAGYGAVITDAGGAVLAELSEFLGRRTNNFAEYSGLLAVLDWALANGHSRVKVVSDSELMVKQVQGKYKVNSVDLKPLWLEVRARVARLDGFEIAHALRHKNKEADALANQAMDRGMGRGGGGPTVESLALRAPVKAAAAPVAERSTGSAGRPAAEERGARGPAGGAAGPGAMLRGFTKGGVVHLLGGVELPDGVFVKVIRE